MDGKYLSLIDMIDGGGAGRAGDTFQGGGILSALANALARPYGYEDRLRDRKNNTGRAIMTAIDSLRSSPRPQMRPSEPAGPSINPANAYVPMSSNYPDMSMPYIPGYTAPTSSTVTDMPNSVLLRDPGGDYDRAGLITNYLFTRDNNPELLPRWLDRVVELYGIDALRELQASVTPNMSYEGKQIVPTMTQPSVPEIARLASTNPRFSPVFAQDYGDYLEYMNTGRYPRG